MDPDCALAIFPKTSVPAPTPEKEESLKRHLHNYFSTSIRNGSYICFLAKDADRVVGTGGMVCRAQPGNFKNSSGRVGYIMSMYTIPSHRRMGICTRLLMMIVDHGKKEGITAFELHATSDGEPVYAANGFSIHKEPTYRQYFDKDKH